MKCLNCGYCCIQCAVVIVKPRYVEEDLKLDDDKIFMFKTSDKKCPHLRIDENKKASCVIHGYEWYKDTPCFAPHGQIEKFPEEVCRMGEYLLNNEDMRKKLLEKEVVYGP